MQFDEKHQNGRNGIIVKAGQEVERLQPAREMSGKAYAEKEESAKKSKKDNPGREESVEKSAEKSKKGNPGREESVEKSKKDNPEGMDGSRKERGNNEGGILAEWKWVEEICAKIRREASEYGN